MLSWHDYLRLRRKQTFLQMWLQTRDLYKPEWDAVFESHLRRRLGVRDQVEIKHWAHGSRHASPIYDPLIRIHSMVWICETCGIEFTDGVGCLECAGVFCGLDCALALQHPCPDRDPAKLDEVALLFGITRERVRQIEVEGLRKMCNAMRREGIL